jgi:hypothetical protein
MLLRCEGAKSDDVGRRHLFCAMPLSSDDNHLVVSFRPRRAKSGDIARWSAPIGQGDPSILLSLAKFERDDREDDYRQRMAQNMLAFIVLIALTLIGVWLAVNINNQHDALAPSHRPIDINGSRALAGHLQQISVVGKQ